MLVDAFEGERTTPLLLLLTDSAKLGVGSSLLAATSDDFGEVNGWVRLAGSCMLVKSKAPDGGERLLWLLFSSTLAELQPSFSSLSGLLSFKSILRAIFSLRPSHMLLLLLIVVLWKRWISTHKLSTGPQSATLPRLWRTTHTISDVGGYDPKSDLVVVD